MKRRFVLSLTAMLVCSSAAMAGPHYELEQEKATTSRSVQVSPNSFLGVELGDVNGATVQRLKLREERGALIEGITSGSSAAQAGLQKDDVIVKWDGEPIESARELSRHIRETPAGRNVRLGLIRDGREIEVNVKLGERSAFITRPRIVRPTPAVSAEIRAEAARPREQVRARAAQAREVARTEAARAREQARAEVAQSRTQARAAAAREREVARAAVARVRDQVRAVGRLGVQLQSMTPQLAEYFGLSKRTGALVVFVYADSAASKAGLKAGDVILSAGGQTVESPMDLRRALIEKSEGALELRISRDKQERNVTVQVEKQSGSLLVEADDCIDSVIRAAIAPTDIQVPKIALAPMKINVPKIKIAPIAIPAFKLDMEPMRLTIPKIKIDPIKIVVVPRRVVL